MHAHTAMYRAKELGPDGFQFFTAQLQERANEQFQLSAGLRQALERGEFELHSQPQVSLRSGKVVGIEALLRWRHPELGLVGPGHFIAFAEETGLIIPIGEWVLMRACAQNKAWQDAGLPAMPVAVDISAKQFAQHDLEDVLRRALQQSGLPARYLELELTESVSMTDPDKSVPMMERMKQIGVALSIDDFGMGYSSMSYLRRFPIDRLKLDISFVREITTDPSSLAIADAIISMAHGLHLEVVAKGMNGIEFLSRVRRMYPDTMRIMFSAYDGALVTRQAINEGAVFEFLETSIMPEELKLVVDDAFGLHLSRSEPKLAQENFTSFLLLAETTPRERGVPSCANSEVARFIAQ